MNRLAGRWILWIVALVVALVPITGAGGCSRNNPVATAATADPQYRAETVALALYSTFAVVDSVAATIADNPQTPVEVKRALFQAHQVALPAAQELRGAAVDYNQAREEIAAGAGTAEKVAAASAALERAIGKAAPLIDRLARAVRGEALAPTPAGGES